jgi:hypothetical protein
MSSKGAQDFQTAQQVASRYGPQEYDLGAREISVLSQPHHGHADLWTWQLGPGGRPGPVPQKSHIPW